MLNIQTDKFSTNTLSRKTYFFSFWRKWATPNVLNIVYEFIVYNQKKLMNNDITISFIKVKKSILLRRIGVYNICKYISSR